MKKAIRIVFICVLALVLITVGAVAFRSIDFTNPIHMNLNGERTIFLEYGQHYEEAGATAIISEDGTPVSVTLSGQVDSTRLGKYLIKYTAQSEGHIRTEYRYVHIVDTEAPAITLTSNPNAYTLIGQTYQEEGFSATDNYDGNLTGKVVCEEIDGVMHYTVADSSGNTTTVTRKINYIDPNAPIITLTGGEMSFILAGENYSEPGCTATDFRDGDLSADVIVSGDVDGNIPGIYTLKYSITNSIGVEAVKERIIYVIPKQGSAPDPDNVGLPTPGTVIEPNGKTIYLTFDDGPGPHTDRLLDVLKKYGVKVTFFIKGGTGYEACLTRAAEEGHTVAIHTFSHNYAEIYSCHLHWILQL